MIALLVLLCAIAVVSAAMNCPKSGALMHAGCEVTISFQNSCSEVQAEINARINGQGAGWTDPHNNGTYSILSAADDLYQLQRLTGNEKYTDKINFGFDAKSESECEVSACSESQVYSIGDAGTNFCNSFDLYCNEEGCHSFTKLTYEYTTGKCTECSPNKCLVV